ncbi:unnamed protein product [Adineta steineri]|uniref:Uncharacterized protein n=2 Tax=Adineta steineri TaxID=433720 RepID=A0A818JMF8_9BILA|nr:unnamed protein product [Adineta steineri]
MMNKWYFVITIIFMLCTTCSSDNECIGTITNTTQIVFTCSPTIVYEELPLYNYTTEQLANITSIVVNGLNDSSPGPFTSIPPNICLLPNLKEIDFSNNRMTQVDPADALTNCFTSVTNLDVSYNNISEFPSAIIYNLENLQNLFFQHNQLTDVPGYAFYNISQMNQIDFSYNTLTTFDLWALLVMGTADFRNNQISTITNKYFFDMPTFIQPGYTRKFYLGNNPSINFTDAIYEMYNSCDEVINDVVNSNSYPDPSLAAGLSYNLGFIDFGTTLINCSCDQYYIIQMLDASFGTPIGTFLPIHNATCTDKTLFIDSACSTATNPPSSSVDFSKVYPRQCKIYPSEPGNLTIVPNISQPIANASTYPHYVTELMNPGACYFAFSNTTSVRIKCTNDISSSSTIPNSLLTNSYLSNVTYIDFTHSISALPSYLCSLPSRQIDLSYQSFTTLTDATFPCLDWFHTVKLAYNQLTSVNMTSGNFTNLAVLDLSSNRLTQLPYSILTPTPSSLRYLNLRNNSITSIDIFLYTLKNITVDLSDNPINSSSIINPQNITYPAGNNNTNSTVTILFPSSVTNSTYIFNDQTALTAGTCDRDAILAYRNQLESSYDDVLLDCSCASINLKIIFTRTGYNINDDFNCSDGTTAANFANLTIASCASTALNFSSGLCYNESLQWTTTTTTTTTSTSTSTTSVTTTSTSTSTSTTSVTTTSTSTSTSTTSVTTTSTSTSTSTTSITTTSTSTSTTSITTTTTTNNTSGVLPLLNDSSASRTGLIVGLVLGLVAFLVLIGGLIVALVIVKARSARNVGATSKPVGRATAISQAPQSALLQSRLQTRNLRSVRLTPLHTQPSYLPPSPFHPVAPTTMSADSPSALFNKSNLHTSVRGIPIRFDPIRSPNSIASQHEANMHPSNDHPNFIQQQFQEPRARSSQLNQMLNLLHPTICSADVTNWPNLTLTCPNGTILTQLPFPSSDIPLLRTITSFRAQGENNTRGPFTTIPSNICWMSDLNILNLNYNQLGSTLDFSNFINCSIQWQTVDLSQNYIATFPSLMFTLNQFNSVYLNNNQLTSIDMSIVTRVKGPVDLRNNQITSFINPTNYTISLDRTSLDPNILLDGNPMLQLTDAIYEMYGSCLEVQLALNDSLLVAPPLTQSLLNLNFGNTTINCSCDQYYILFVLGYNFGSDIFGPISSLTCANVPFNFVNYTCPLANSTVDFTQVSPRLCNFYDQTFNTTTTTLSITSATTTLPTTITSTNPITSIASTSTNISMTTEVTTASTNTPVTTATNTTTFITSITNATATFSSIDTTVTTATATITNATNTAATATTATTTSTVTGSNTSILTTVTATSSDTSTATTTQVATTANITSSDTSTATTTHTASTVNMTSSDTSTVTTTEAATTGNITGFTTITASTTEAATTGNTTGSSTSTVSTTGAATTGNTTGSSTITASTTEAATTANTTGSSTSTATTTEAATRENTTGFTTITVSTTGAPTTANATGSSTSTASTTEAATTGNITGFTTITASTTEAATTGNITGSSTSTASTTEAATTANTTASSTITASTTEAATTGNITGSSTSTASTTEAATTENTTGFTTITVSTTGAATTANTTGSATSVATTTEAATTANTTGSDTSAVTTTQAATTGNTTGSDTSTASSTHAATTGNITSTDTTTVSAVTTTNGVTIPNITSSYTSTITTTHAATTANTTGSDTSTVTITHAATTANTTESDTSTATTAHTATTANITSSDTTMVSTVTTTHGATTENTTGSDTSTATTTHVATTLNTTGSDTSTATTTQTATTANTTGSGTSTVSTTHTATIENTTGSDSSTATTTHAATIANQTSSDSTMLSTVTTTHSATTANTTGSDTSTATTTHAATTGNITGSDTSTVTTTQAATTANITGSDTSTVTTAHTATTANITSSDTSAATITQAASTANITGFDTSTVTTTHAATTANATGSDTSAATTSHTAATVNTTEFDTSTLTTTHGATTANITGSDTSTGTTTHSATTGNTTGSDTSTVTTTHAATTANTTGTDTSTVTATHAATTVNATGSDTSTVTTTQAATTANATGSDTSAATTTHAAITANTTGSDTSTVTTTHAATTANTTGSDTSTVTTTHAATTANATDSDTSTITTTHAATTANTTGSDTSTVTTVHTATTGNTTGSDTSTVTTTHAATTANTTGSDTSTITTTHAATTANTTSSNTTVMSTATITYIATTESATASNTSLITTATVTSTSITSVAATSVTSTTANATGSNTSIVSIGATTPSISTSALTASGTAVSTSTNVTIGTTAGSNTTMITTTVPTGSSTTTTNVTAASTSITGITSVTSGANATSSAATTEAMTTLLNGTISTANITVTSSTATSNTTTTGTIFTTVATATTITTSSGSTNSNLTVTSNMLTITGNVTDTSTATITVTLAQTSITTTSTSVSITNTSTCGMTLSSNNTNLLLSCLTNASLTLLPINNYDLATLNKITSLKVEGLNGTRGPLASIPPNICFLTNLQELDISFNRLNYVDTSFFSSNPSCLGNLQILDISNNYLTDFPSMLLTKTTNIEELFLENNQLTSFDLALTVLVSTAVDLSNNQISKIINNDNIHILTYNQSLGTSIDLSNNSQIMYLTDSIYEMYDACQEVQQLFNSSITPITPILTMSFLNINFDISRINCSCDQYYIQKEFFNTYNNSLPSNSSLAQTMCTDGTLFYNNTHTAACSSSSANFNNTIPRLCQLNQNNGSVVLANTTNNNITGTYPQYLTQSINNSYCIYTFYASGIRASIDCIDGSNNLTEIPSVILNNTYFQNISEVIINNQTSMSQLPIYLCSLPSAKIDLSNQSFNILNSNTFPCAAYSTLRNISLDHNHIYNVNLTYVNWISFDLSFNNLTQLPYSLLYSNVVDRTSRLEIEQTLDLSSNQLSQFDLFVYTYPNTNIDLENNPFTTVNGYNIINNYQKQSLRSGPVSISVTVTNPMRFLLNDTVAQNYNTCDSTTIVYLIEIFQTMKNNNIVVQIDCQCSSIYIKEYLYLSNSSDKLTSLFSCSNTSSLTMTQFDNLTETDCLANITLSSNRLCTFSRIDTTSLSSSTSTSDNGRLLAIILGSVLGSIAFILLIALILYCLCRNRKKTEDTPNITVFGRSPVVSTNRRRSIQTATRSVHSSRDIKLSSESEHIHSLRHFSPTEITTRSPPRNSQLHYRDSLNSLEQNIFYGEQDRNRQLRQPPTDFDISRSFRHLENASPTSSFI